jgi:hypothetical protein
MYVKENLSYRKDIDMNEKTYFTLCGYEYLWLFEISFYSPWGGMDFLKTTDPIDHKANRSNLDTD